MCGFLATDAANTARILLTNLGEVDWTALWYPSTSIPPAFPFLQSPRNSRTGFRLSPSSILYSTLSSKERKMAQSFCNNIGSFNTVNNVNAADERSNILAWLSPLEPRLQHKDIQDRRVKNIGEWVLETEAFKSWYAGSGENESDNAVLFCYGDPGVGKTFIRYQGRSSMNGGRRASANEM